MNRPPAHPPAHTRTTRKRGFTLLEVITTIALLTLVLPAIVQGFNMAGKMAILTRQKAEAVAVAQTLMDQLMALQPWVNGGMDSAGNSTPGKTQFQWQWTIGDSQQAIAEDVTNVQELILTVNWTSENNAQQQLILTTDIYIPDSTLQTTATGGIP